MSAPERAGGTRTQREQKAIALIDDLGFSALPERIAFVVAALGEEYRRGFQEAWEECQAEAAPEPVKQRQNATQRDVAIVKNPKGK